MRLGMASLVLLCGCDAVFRIDPLDPPTTDDGGGDAGNLIPMFVQSAAIDNLALGRNMTKAFASPLGGRSLVVAFVSWTGTTNVLGVVAGTVMLQKLGTDVRQNGLAQVMYYAENVPTGNEQVFVTWDADSANRDLRILEYSGVATTASLDRQANATGSSMFASATVTTTHDHDVLVCGVAFGTRASGPGNGFNERNITTNTGSITEDRIVDTAGTYDATAPQLSADAWVLQVGAFKGE